MAKPRKGKVVAIDAWARSWRANRQGPAKSLEIRTHDQAEAWFEIVDRLAGFVWSSARAGQVSAQVTAEVFRITWLRFADHVMDVPHDAVEAWLQKTVARERIRIAALRTGPLGLDLWYKRYE
jgi:hypothetical protein